MSASNPLPASATQQPRRAAIRRRTRFIRFTLFPLATWALATTAPSVAQLAVRPDDPVGLSIREERVRVVHSDDARIPGTSMHLQQTDPWLAYQRGRSYYFREWGTRDGVFRHVPKRPEAASATSCGMCHNTPFPSAGAGGNVGIKMRVGRNAPHFFGGGLLETMGLQIRAQLLDLYDDNGNGFLDVPRETRGRRAVVEVSPGVPVDFGSLEDLDGNGRPDLNPAIMVRLVDTSGTRLLFNQAGLPPKLDDPGIVGYDLAVGVFASSSGDHQFPSMRSFAAGVFVTILGILPEGEAVVTRPIGFVQGHLLTNWGRLSNSGAFQSDLLLTADPNAAAERLPRATITPGELDLLDWFMVNHPAPALGPQDATTRRGRELMTEFGCTSCHLPELTILPADPERGLPGDRRFFDLEVRYEPSRDRLEGRLKSLTRQVETADGNVLLLPKRQGFTIEDVFTDLLHHDLGPRFWEYTFWQGKLYTSTKKFRTAPLWGVGSTAPYGHDGRSATLDDVIRRHGGAAEEARAAYAGAAPAERQALLAFLSSLVLYPPETLPTDLNGDGKIESAFRLGGRDVGPEIFRPELLLRVTPIYRGWTSSPDGGDRSFSYELLNTAAAYGEDLEALKDSDGDTVPDISEPGTGMAPATGVSAQER